MTDDVDSLRMQLDEAVRVAGLIQATRHGALYVITEDQPIAEINGAKLLAAAQQARLLVDGIVAERDDARATLDRVKARLLEYAEMASTQTWAADDLYRVFKLGKQSGWVDVTAYALAAFDPTTSEDQP